MSEQKSINRGLAWIGVASSLVSLLDLVAILLLLNFWISKTEYGIATECVWLFPILDQATDLGLSAAVIQRDDHSETKISTVFWLNFLTAGALFVVLLVGAPLLSTLIFEHSVVGWMIVAYASKLLWQNIYFIPTALMKRELRFKELSVIRIVANIAEFGGKVGFAAAGFGIWCFVLGPLCRVLVTGIGCQICHPWRPKFLFKLREARDYIGFGMKTSASQILFYFYTNIDYPIVGYYFGPRALAAYRLAYEVVLEPVRMISNVVVDVAFPAFAKLRHAREKLIAQFISFTRLNLVTVLTYSAIVFVSAEEVLAVIFPGYPEAAPAVRVLCIVAVFRAVSFVVPPLLDGIGRPSRTFVYTVTAAIVLPLFFLIGAIVLGDSMGYLSVAIAWAVGYPIAFAILVLLALYTLSWSVRAYLRAVSGIPVCAIAAAIVGWGVRFGLQELHAGTALTLGITTLVIVGVMMLLLAKTQNMSLWRAKKAMAGDPPPPDQPIDPPTD